MRVVDVEELKDMDYSLLNARAIFQFWKNGSSWTTPETGRHRQALIFVSSTRNAYYFGERVICNAQEGDIVYIPKGARYTVYLRASDKVENERFHKTAYESLPNYYTDGELSGESCPSGYEYTQILVDFDLFDERHEEFLLADRISVFRFENAEKIKALFLNAAAQAAHGLVSPVKLNIAMYTLLNMIAETAYKTRVFQHNHRVLLPAIQYLETHDLGAISVQDLADVCGLSNTGFRIAFKKRMGVTPLDYILNLKIERAKQLLQSGELPIAVIAERIGFHDPGYFSRFYKQKTGHSPSDEPVIGHPDFPSE